MALRYLTAGESHGPFLLAILDGLPAGLGLSPFLIEEQFARRQRGYGAGPRMKIESDSVRLLGGILEGVTTGAPLAMEIENKDHAKWKGAEVPPFTRPRPGHADLSGAIKYGYHDLRPSLERASARETAARVAVGAVCRHLLHQFGIEIGGYVRSIGEISVDVEGVGLRDRARIAEENDVRAPDLEAAKVMRDRIRHIMEEGDTLGGTIDVFAVGLPPGLGSFVQWDRRLDARLGGAVLSVQAMKGVEIGPAFENARRRGTEVHDAILIEGENLIRPTNNAGGLEGGITNGEPVMIRAAMKPIATTLTPQRTVDLASGEGVPTRYERSDFCPVPRAVPILEAVVAYVLADALLEKLGGDSLEEMLPRYKALRKARLSDLEMDGSPHTFWPEEGE
jgi:chorismate synthase